MTTTDSQDRPAPLETITPDTITHSHKQSHETTINNQFTDNSYKINFTAHLRIMIPRVAETGQTTHYSLCRGGSC